ncbi:BPSS1780 family membrane protein [Caenimonas koreensis]|uniref:Transmembrane protein n=1 Tax=Caenimonas koreensis DSM 17982 TaxID=1121255 RepID=A0A844AQU4_9BURK|nr:BPSS1780 family membrane protein [Caenimonas koreensis]MRD46670.1 hypothetical protein [Caenimonas koreensis DSM 17982]
MKLNIVPAGTGIQWVKLGIRTFMRQPLALTALFFLYIAAASLLWLVPILGPLLGAAVVPAATLGFMAATQEAVNGNVPTPMVFLGAFRAGRARVKAMLVLGLMYAVLWIGILLLVGVLVDLPTDAVTPDAQHPPSPAYVNAMLLAFAMYVPVSLMFWHAPALVHWHGISPLKSLFFSSVACVRNWKAMIVFNLAWLVLIIAFGTIISTVSMLTGSGQLSVGIAMPLALLVAAVFSTSLFFTFRDSFVPDEPTPEPPTSGDSP